MPSRAKVLGDGAIRRQKSLGMPRGLEPLHAILTLPRGTMGVLTAVVEVTTLPVFDPRQDLPFRRAVALQLVGDDHPWHVLQSLEQLTKELLGCLLIPPALDQDIEDVVVLIDGSPEVMALALVGFQGRGCAAVVQRTCCHPTLLEYLIFQWS